MKPMSGWISFAAIMMMIIGTLDFFEGLIAVIRGNYYAVSSSQSSSSIRGRGAGSP
jgi:hypothetical protein